MAGLSWLLRPLGVLLLCTFINGLMERYFEPANLIMVYLAGVVFVALRQGLRAALFAVAGSVLLFDLIFVAPRWSLNPIEPQYFFTFGLMGAVGWLISQLAANKRQQALVAEARLRRAQALNALALDLAGARSEAEVGQSLCRRIESGLGLTARLLPAEAAAASVGELRLPLSADGQLLAQLALTSPGPLAEEDRELLASFASQSAIALERARFERQSAEARLTAESERLRNTLLAGISHDFRTPLTTIVGSATSLIEQDLALDEGHRRALLTGIVGEARRMHALMSDLLDLSRLEEGAVQPEPEWCPVDELVGEVLAGLGPRLAQHRVRMELTPDALLWCDARLIQQLLSNLLDNARRHTPVGGLITLSFAPGALEARLSVQDSGPGLPPGREQELFKKFVRGQSEPSGSGTGLGLAICAAVAQLHGGRLEASTRDGACFCLVLPQPPQPADAAEEGV